MRGTLYGVGVGPGDPKLMTCLAVETIERCPVIAVPSGGGDRAVSYRIAKQAVENLDRKECLRLSTPMTKNRRVLNESYEAAADEIAKRLDEGKDVAYLTLGDPTIYSTYIYIHRIAKRRGYDACIVSGVPSFCAAAARIGDSLADRSQQIHIIPSSYDVEEAMDYKGTRIFMKAASGLSRIKTMLLERNQAAVMVENCGMADERICPDVRRMPDEAGYYTILVAREEPCDRAGRPYEERPPGK
ncbi:MAG: precorrin-2 C(20)-methyltransferase [Hungatella sp.]|nr:precorrin-2 C(20)-methyltransferase [Hungatella sp.]